MHKIRHFRKSCLRSICWLALALGCLCCYSVNAEPQFVLTVAAPKDPSPTTSYDVVRDLTEVQSAPIDLGQSGALVVLKSSYVYQGKKPVRPLIIMVTIGGAGHIGSWWKGTTEVYSLFGKTRITFPVDYASSVTNEGVTEIVRFWVLTSTFEQMVKEKQITFQLAGKNYTLEGAYDLLP